MIYLLYDIEETKISVSLSTTFEIIRILSLTLLTWMKGCDYGVDDSNIVSGGTMIICRETFLRSSFVIS